MQIALNQVIGLVDALNARVVTTLNINTSNGIAGGGDLSASLYLSLDGNALALHNLATTGLIALTGTGIIEAREIVGSARIIVTDGDGIADNPTIDMASIITPGTYSVVGVDAYGRVTSGSAPTTLAGYGISDAISTSGGTMLSHLAFGNSIGSTGPTLNTIPNGTRLLLRSTATASFTNYAIGYKSNEMWFGVQGNNNSYAFAWYGGDISVARLSGTGNLDLNGSLTAVTKSFLIPHPTRKNHTLRYGSLEGPENAVYLRGVLKENSSFIPFPPYWSKLVDMDTITVHVTSYNFGTYGVGKITSKGVMIFYNREFPIHASYLVMAERKDVPRLRVEQKIKSVS